MLRRGSPYKGSRRHTALGSCPGTNQERKTGHRGVSQKENVKDIRVCTAFPWEPQGYRGQKQFYQEVTGSLTGF